MNILILTTHLNPGGLSRYVLNLAKGLSEKQHNVYVGCSGGEWAKYLKEQNVGYKKLPIDTKSILSIKILFSAVILSRWCRLKRIEVIHANTRVTQLLGLLMWKLSRIPYISTFHGFYKHIFFRRLIKISGVKTIAISKAVRKYLIEDLKFKERNIELVYNGVDFESLSSRINIREKYGFTEADFLIGILGRISEEKGQFLALDALHNILVKNKDVYFLVSGKGKQEVALKTLVQKLKLNKKVKFVQCESGEFLNTVNILLVPSRKEGFGYSIVEAFFKEVPVIGYNTGGISEIIKNNINGFLFYGYNREELEKRIEETMSNSDVVNKIIIRAKEDALSFSYTKMAEATERVYKEAMNLTQ